MDYLNGSQWIVSIWKCLTNEWRHRHVLATEWNNDRTYSAKNVGLGLGCILNSCSVTDLRKNLRELVSYRALYNAGVCIYAYSYRILVHAMSISINIYIFIQTYICISIYISLWLYIYIYVEIVISIIIYIYIYIWIYIYINLCIYIHDDLYLELSKSIIFYSFLQ